MSRVSLSRSNISSASSSSSRQIKLRTILKNRGGQTPLNQQIKGQSIRTTGFKALEEDEHRKSVSLNLNKMSRLSKRSSKYSESRNTRRESDTQNCEEELLGKRDNNYMYKIMMNKLNELEKEAEMLICRKIKKMNKKSAVLTLKNKGKDQITEQIQRLIEKIKSVTIQELEQHVSSKQMIREFADKKINILQKLMAQKSAESDVLKNYFFVINALSSQEKGYHHIQGYQKIQQLGKLNNSKLMPLLKRQRARTQAKQPISNQSLNKHSYHAPKLDQYETYRYKNKGYVQNTQPLPRSSYKREYLFYNPQQVQTKLKALDNHVNIGISRIKSSTYHYDYKPVKTDLINFKELDGYKNKIKNIDVSYESNYRKQKSNKELQKSKSYFLDQQSINSAISGGKYQSKNLFSFDVKQKVDNRSEAKDKFRQFDKPTASTIKHKRLDKYKYAFKTLANS